MQKKNNRRKYFLSYYFKNLDGEYSLNIGWTGCVIVEQKRFDRSDKLW